MIDVTGQRSVNVGLRVRFAVGILEYTRNVANDDQDADDRNRSVAIALDEFGRLVDKVDIIFDLHMLSQQTKTKRGLVLISNPPSEGLVFDDRSWSRLNCQPLECKPYTADDLQAILEDRVEQAF